MPSILRTFGHKRRSFREYIDLFLHSLWTVICPPLIFDWEEFYIKSQGKLQLMKCWTKSMRLYYLFNGLFYIEHIIFCIPIIMLKSSINQRNSELHGHFSLLPEVDTHILSFFTEIDKLNILLILGGRIHQKY